MTIKPGTISRVLIKVVIAYLLFGCTSSMPGPNPIITLSPSPGQMDKSPFTGIPCAAPCWHGLEVGKSNETDVNAVVPILTFIDQGSVQVYRRPSMPDYYIMSAGPGMEISAKCINSEKECLNLTTANNVLQKIIVGLNYDIRPDEAISYLGIPDYIGAANLGGETFLCEVYLIWRRSRLVLATTFRDSAGAKKYCYAVRDEGKVPASLPILEARYLSDEELDAYLAYGKFFEFSGTLPDK